MPTTARSVRVPDELWEAAIRRTSEQHEYVTDVIIRALTEYVTPATPADPLPAAEPIGDPVTDLLLPLREAMRENATSFTCQEANVWASLLRVAHAGKDAEEFLRAHAAGDEPEDQHYGMY